MGPDTWRQSGCCCGGSEKVTQIDIYGDGRLFGLIGLDTIFQQLSALGRSPDASVQDELVQMVAARNYVPKKEEPAYGVALVREYAKFCSDKKR